MCAPSANARVGGTDKGSEDRVGTVRLTKFDDDARVIVERLTGESSRDQHWAGDEFRYTVEDVTDEHAAQIAGVQLYRCDARWFEHLQVMPGSVGRGDQRRVVG